VVTSSAIYKPAIQFHFYGVINQRNKNDNMTLVTYDLSDVNSVYNLMEQLFELFKKTLNPNLTMREFRHYFFSQHPDSLEVSIIHEGDKVAGFCTSAAYPRKLRGRKVVILRSAFGLLDEYKKGGFPLHGLFFKYMKYKLTHLFTPVYVVGFMANPLMYAMICKYTKTCYPRVDKPTPERMKEFADDLMSSMNLDRKKVADFVVKIHFQVKFNEQDVERFESSDDRNVKYFLDINKGYREQMGVMVVVPVTISNMTYTMLKYTGKRLRKMFGKKTKK
jgi:hypothetical protein